jgi:hypothetical protein
MARKADIGRFSGVDGGEGEEVSDSWYKVLLKDNNTGEERWYKYDFEWDHDGADEYMWTDGNYGCDCNRHLFFGRAIGQEPREDYPCGKTRYTAICAELPNGTRYTLDNPQLVEGRG